MEGRSRERWKLATSARKWPFNLQRRTAARTFFILLIPSLLGRQPRLLLPGDPEEATSGSGPSRTSEKPLAYLLRPKPNHTHTWFQGAYEPQRNASVVLYAQGAYEHLVFSQPPLRGQHKSASTTGKGQFSGYLLNNCQDTCQPTAVR